MYAITYANDPGAFGVVAAGGARVHILADVLARAFTGHINWPSSMLQQYDYSVDGYTLFLIPFLVHVGVERIGTFEQSMKAPDGGLEIFGVHAFFETNPQALLQEYVSLADFIKMNRPDIVSGA